MPPSRLASTRATEPTTGRTFCTPEHEKQTKETNVGSKDKPQFKTLTREELEELAGEPLPERAAMSLINANVAAPINAALALNVLSDNSVAYANAEQIADIDQSN